MINQLGPTVYHSDAAPSALDLAFPPLGVTSRAWLFMEDAGNRKESPSQGLNKGGLC